MGRRELSEFERGEVRWNPAAPQTERVSGLLGGIGSRALPSVAERSVREASPARLLAVLAGVAVAGAAV